MTTTTTTTTTRGGKNHARTIARARRECSLRARLREGRARARGTRPRARTRARAFANAFEIGDGFGEGAFEDVDRENAIDGDSSHAKATAMEEVGEAARGAARVPLGVTRDDFTNYYGILNAQSAEDVDRAIDSLIARGEFTEGVVEAALATYQEAEKRGEIGDVVDALRGVFEYVLDRYQRANAPRALKVIDEIVSALGELDVKERASEEAQNGVMREVLARAATSAEAFAADVDGFLQTMVAQDAQFDAQVAQMRAEGMDDERQAQVARLIEMRGAAKEQMLVIRAVAGRLAR